MISTDNGIRRERLRAVSTIALRCNAGIFASAVVNGDGFFEHGSLGFAEKIPAPGAAGLFGLAAFAARRRR